MWVALSHVLSRRIVVKGTLLDGCTHQVPLLAKRTTRCPVFAPVTRPAILSVLVGPPGAASGTTVISIEGGRQPANNEQTRTAMTRKKFLTTFQSTVSRHAVFAKVIGSPGGIGNHPVEIAEERGVLPDGPTGGEFEIDSGKTGLIQTGGVGETVIRMQVALHDRSPEGPISSGVDATIAEQTRTANRHTVRRHNPENVRNNLSKPEEPHGPDITG
jgi:hypothetical protein